jgi:hypothetical protein
MLEYDNTTQAIRQNIDIEDRIKVSDFLGVGYRIAYP